MQAHDAHKMMPLAANEWEDWTGCSKAVHVPESYEMSLSRVSQAGSPWAIQTYAFGHEGLPFKSWHTQQDD